MGDREPSQRSAGARARVLFLGRRNSFNLGIIEWLEENFKCVGAYFVEPDRFKWTVQWRRLAQRARRRGWGRVVDELAYHFWFRIFDKRVNEKLISLNLPERFHERGECPVPNWDVHDPHEPEWTQKLKALSPDFVFVVCCNVILEKEFYGVPRLGAFVLHEGLTPEYRGLHAPLWALVEKNPQGIGYSLIQISGSIDGGPILVQGRVAFSDLDRRKWSYIGHASLVEGLPRMEEALKRLVSTGHFEPVSVAGRKDRYVTWMPLSTYLKSLIFGKLP